ncbi:MAG TPA: DUF2281 domain-containing protein [Candidatus Cloacimonetes bacterium]|nr:DUF2281 domain-containing protein [Candidatus Cloacimonadota bacterium]
MHQVSLNEAKKIFPKLIDEVLIGEEILITKNRKPIIKMSSIRAKKTDKIKRIRPGSAKGLFQIMDDFDEPLDDFKDYM